MKKSKKIGGEAFLTANQILQGRSLRAEKKYSLEVLKRKADQGDLDAKARIKMLESVELRPRK